MRILVTGGAGFIGSHLVEKLLAAGREVAILDDFNDFYDPQIKHANIAGFAKEITVHHVDLRDSASVRSLFHREKFETIAHLAARAGVRPSIQHPQLYYDTNVSGTLHLLDAARVIGVERFIFASSSSVYGISKTVPFSEDQHLTQTLSTYAATKIAGEFLCSTYSHLYRMHVVALRYFTVYGPRQRPDLAIHQFTRRIYADQPIDQFGDGTTRRDYTYIDDVIQGTMAALAYQGPSFDIFDRSDRECAWEKSKDQSAAGAARRHAVDLRRRFQSEKITRVQSNHTIKRRTAAFHRLVSPNERSATVNRQSPCQRVLRICSLINAPVSSRARRNPALRF